MIENVKKISNGGNTMVLNMTKRHPLEKMVLGNPNHTHSKLIMGGSVKNAGWDPKHPRLSRDPSWYEGRGKDRAKEFGNSVLKGVEMAAEIVPEIL